ncbi:MAG: DUF2993 domain-containing protein [Armatimonadia bacterium]
MFRSRRPVLMGLLGVFLVSSLAWAALTPAQVAGRIRNKINSKWKTTSLVVNVVPLADPTETAKGHFKSICVSAAAVYIHDIKMAPVKMSATDVTLDLNQLVRQNAVVTKKRKTGHFFAKASENDLNKALKRKKNSIQNLHMTLGNGTLTFTGTYKFGIGANLKLTGRLECPDHYRVNFVPTKASVNGVPLPAGPLKGVLSKMNPLLDFRKLPLSPRIEKVLVQPGMLTMSG